MLAMMSVVGANTGGQQLQYTVNDEDLRHRDVNYDHTCLASLDGLCQPEHLERVC